MCNLETYRGRMWCRAEQLCFTILNGTRQMFVATGAHASQITHVNKVHGLGTPDLDAQPRWMHASPPRTLYPVPCTLHASSPRTLQAALLQPICAHPTPARSLNADPNMYPNMAMAQCVPQGPCDRPPVCARYTSWAVMGRSCTGPVGYWRTSRSSRVSRPMTAIRWAG